MGMEEIIWFVLLIAFAVFEGATAGLVSIWFAIGSLGGIAVALLNGSVPLQILVFALISLVAMLALRPLAKKYLLPKPEKTNADRILEAEGIVTETVDNLAAKGQIRIKGEQWTARSDDESVIEEGAHVSVLRIEGVKAIVQRT